RRDFQTVGFECDKLSRVVREDTHRVNLQRSQYLSAYSILALLALQSNGFVGFHISHSVGLEFCRTYFAHRLQVKKHTASFGFNGFDRTVHLFVAMACDGSKHVAGQTVGVHANKHILAVADFAFHNGIVRFVAEYALKPDHAKLTVPRSQNAFAGLSHEVFRFQPVSNEIRDGDQFHVVCRGELQQIRDTSHRSIFLHDFADHAGWKESRTAGDVHGRFGLSGTNQHSTILCPQRENVTWPGQIAWFRSRIDRGEDSLSTIVSRNPR